MLTDAEYERLRPILKRDARYPAGAYEVVLDTISFIRNYKALKGQKMGHIYGQDLCKYMIKFLVHGFGLMANQVAEDCGFKQSEDVGNVVYNMIEVGLLNKSEEDKKSHFYALFDVPEAINREFENANFCKRAKICSIGKDYPLAYLKRYGTWTSLG